MAEFIAETDKMQVWKYTITEFTLILPSSTINIPTERITGLTIENDYETNVFPIIQLSMILEPSVYNQIIQNKNDVKLKLRLQKFYTEVGKEDKSLYRDQFNTTFSLLMDDDYLDTDTYIDLETKTNTDDDASDVNKLDQMDNKTSFPLFKYDTIQAMRTMINTVLINVSMIGALAYIGATTKLNNLLVSPMENNTVYPELLLPPQTALSTIQYLDSEYGFYRSGSIIFFGIDHSYVLNYRGGCTAYAKDEIQETCIMIPERGGRYGGMEGSLEKPDEKTKRNYILVRSENIDVKNESISNDIIEGNNAVIVNTNTNTIISASGNSDQRGTGNSNVINTNTSNPWIGETYAAQKTASSAVINVSCGDFDVACINPNKKFSFLFEDTKSGEKYKGTYILTNSFLNFTKDGNNMSLNASMTFKRPSKEISVSSEEL